MARESTVDRFYYAARSEALMCWGNLTTANNTSAWRRSAALPLTALGGSSHACSCAAHSYFSPCRSSRPRARLRKPRQSVPLQTAVPLRQELLTAMGVFTGHDFSLIERFSLAAPDMLLYEFTVTNPKFFAQPWTAGAPMVRTNARMFEYACHEGNYGLEFILRGARAAEKERRPAGVRRLERQRLEVVAPRVSKINGHVSTAGSALAAIQCDWHHHILHRQRDRAVARGSAIFVIAFGPRRNPIPSYSSAHHYV